MVVEGLPGNASMSWLVIGSKALVAATLQACLWGAMQAFGGRSCIIQVMSNDLGNDPVCHAMVKLNPETPQAAPRKAMALGARSSARWATTSP